MNRQTYLIVPLLVIFCALAIGDSARCADEPQETPSELETKTIPVSSLKDVEFDCNQGGLEFVLSGTTYRFQPQGGYQAVISSAAFLDQMRKAKTIIIQSRPWFDLPAEGNPTDFKSKRRIVGMSIVFDSINDK